MCVALIGLMAGIGLVMLAPDIEELLVAWLSPVGACGTLMSTNPTMPFILVTRLSGGDDAVTEEATVSVHCFHNTRSLAAEYARQVHYRMKNLLPKTPILMSNGSYVSVDYVYVIEAPAWRDYEDKTLWRYCGRYRIDLRLNPSLTPY